MIKIFTKRERIILYITIGVIVFAATLKFIISPILIKNQDLNRQVNLSRLKLKKYLRLQSQKDYLQNKYSQFSSSLKLSGQKDAPLVNVLSKLENLARNANVRIIDIRPQAPRGLDLYQEFLIDLRAEATMEGYLKFIYNLENSLLLLRIKRFQLAAKPNSQILEANFSISQISLKD